MKKEPLYLLFDIVYIVVFGYKEQWFSMRKGIFVRLNQQNWESCKVTQ